MSGIHAPQKVVDPITHYIIVRRNLPTGTICAMVAHAAGESYIHPHGNQPVTVVVLGAKHEPDLRRLAARLHRSRTREHRPFRLFRETDPPYTGSLMAIGLRPAYKSKLVHLTKGYGLLRFPEDSQPV